jgi:hypothetical protein
MRDPRWLAFLPLLFTLVLLAIEPYTSGAADRGPDTPNEE